MKVLIKNADHVVTVDKARRIIRDGAIIVTDGRIEAVGKTSEIISLCGSNVDETLNATGQIVLPGLIDTHVHIHEHLSRGLFPDNQSTRPWVFDWEMPYIASLNPEEERLSALHACIEMIKTGTTCFIDAGVFHHKEVASALTEIGIRGVVGRAHISDKKTSEIPASWKKEWTEKLYYDSAESALSEARRVVKELRGYSQRITPWVILEGIGTCSDELYVGGKRLAEELDVGIYYHLASSVQEAKMTEAETGDWPITHLHKINALSDRLLLVHAVTVKDEEVKLLKEHDTKVAHCPGSAFVLAKGVSQLGRIPEMNSSGVTVGLGCDGACSGGSFDMFRQMFLAAGLYKDCRMNPSMLGAEVAVEMATINGARALLMEDQIGSVEPGKKADLVMYDLRRAEWLPTTGSIVRNLVYSANGCSAHTVLIDGDIVMRNGRITTINEDQVFSAINESAAKVAERAGLKPPQNWPII